MVAMTSNLMEILWPAASPCWNGVSFVAPHLPLRQEPAKVRNFQCLMPWDISGRFFFIVHGAASVVFAALVRSLAKATFICVTLLDSCARQQQWAAWHANESHFTTDGDIAPPRCQPTGGQQEKDDCRQQRVLGEWWHLHDRCQLPQIVSDRGDKECLVVWPGRAAFGIEAGSLP